MKKTFVEPELDVLKIHTEDILETSGNIDASGDPIELPGQP